MKTFEREIIEPFSFDDEKRNSPDTIDKSMPE